MFKKGLFSLLIIAFFANCKTAKLKRTISKKVTTSFYENQFTGIYIFDVKANKEVYNYNGEKYFTPASNIKIFTLFTGLTMLPDSIPAFKYAVNKDTITIQGTGDPTFLHNYFKDSTALKMIDNYAKANIIINNSTDKRFGPGWAWEDFDSYFSAERSAFPMYGNVITIQNEDSIIVQPAFYQSKIKITKDFYGRDEYKNNFYFRKDQKMETEIPMLIDSTLIATLWNVIAPNKVSIIKSSALKPSTIAYSVSSDSLYRRMMEVSDNFLAEQILVLASSTLSDTLSSKKVRKYMLENALKDLKQQPRWVDGSGLSRYNLCTPISFVEVLTKLYKTIPQNRLFHLFPVGGEFGTIKDWYAGTDKPYVFAKTGTVGNNYNVSGYLLTNSGKVLIFSFMNNHFKKTNDEIRTQMQTTFEWLRDYY
ncbi:D-alanyl-D-alanine carboxypeptidase DacB [Polaribacter huanghezhanensis]|uniref:D-alanyl-D-alanine carboxypeptidase n=1 Tax=Polaribacter huanghezhanensis TaxID=1354726 RepID=UPI0026472134|nr:D-alanyl-D-alanine carboxypeptidase [Polaribacter huanghezhanensis]WKD85344.1 D-alanyl-D-alanine carboxypeptidase DacB [Polaribacter huanghezhanensis]